MPGEKQPWNTAAFLLYFHFQWNGLSYSLQLGYPILLTTSMVLRKSVGVFEAENNTFFLIFCGIAISIIFKVKYVLLFKGKFISLFLSCCLQHISQNVNMPLCCCTLAPGNVICMAKLFRALSLLCSIYPASLHICSWINSACSIKLTAFSDMAIHTFMRY